MIIKPFEISDFNMLQLQPQQAWVGEHVTQAHMQTLAQGFAFTGVHGDLVIACAGIMELHAHRAHAWALLSTNAADHMLELHRAVRRALEVSPYDRIETTIECDHAAGHRWATMLGFICEAECMWAYGENGSDHAMYRWAG